MINTWSFYYDNGLLHDIMYRGPIEFLNINTPENTKPIVGEYSNKNKKVIIVDSVPTVIDYVPEKPQVTDLIDWIWNDTIKEWDITPTLISLRNTTVLKLKEQFSNLNNSNIIFQGKEFQADEKSKEALFKQFQLSIGNPNFSVNWILADNTMYTLSYTTIKELVEVIDARTQILVTKLYELRSKVQTATSEELSSIKLEL